LTPEALEILGKSEEAQNNHVHATKTKHMPRPISNRINFTTINSDGKGNSRNQTLKGKASYAHGSDTP